MFLTVRIIIALVPFAFYISPPSFPPVKLASPSAGNPLYPRKQEEQHLLAGSGMEIIVALGLQYPRRGRVTVFHAEARGELR